jgi:hypothetical protein
LREIEHERALAKAIVDTVREPLVVLDRDLRVVELIWDRRLIGNDKAPEPGGFELTYLGQLPLVALAGVLSTTLLSGLLIALTLLAGVLSATLLSGFLSTLILLAGLLSTRILLTGILIALVWIIRIVHGASPAIDPLITKWCGLRGNQGRLELLSPSAEYRAGVFFTYFFSETPISC